MKKLLLLVTAALGLCSLSAYAEVTAGQFDSTKKYYIQWVNPTGTPAPSGYWVTTDTSTDGYPMVNNQKASAFNIIQDATDPSKIKLKVDGQDTYVSKGGYNWTVALTQASASTYWYLVDSDSDSYFRIGADAHKVDGGFKGGLGLSGSDLTNAENHNLQANKAENFANTMPKTATNLQYWVITDVDPFAELEPEPSIADFYGKNILLKDSKGGYLYSKASVDKNGTVGGDRTVWSASYDDHAVAAILRFNESGKIISVNSGYEFGGKANNSSTLVEVCSSQWSGDYVAHAVAGKENTYVFTTTKADKTDYDGDWSMFVDNNGQLQLAKDADVTDSKYWFTIEEATQFPVSVNSNGYATACYPVAVNANEYAYTVTGIEDGVLQFEPITGVIPAKTPILVRATAGKTVVFDVASADATPSTVNAASFFKGTDIAITGYTATDVMTLQVGDFAPNASVTAGSAYLLTSALGGTYTSVALEKDFEVTIDGWTFMAHHHGEGLCLRSLVEAGENGALDLTKSETPIVNINPDVFGDSHDSGNCLKLTSIVLPSTIQTFGDHQMMEYFQVVRNGEDSTGKEKDWPVGRSRDAELKPSIKAGTSYLIHADLKFNDWEPGVSEIKNYLGYWGSAIMATGNNPTANGYSGGFQLWINGNQNPNELNSNLMLNTNKGKQPIFADVEHRLGEDGVLSITISYDHELGAFCTIVETGEYREETTLVGVTMDEIKQISHNMRSGLTLTMNLGEDVAVTEENDPFSGCLNLASISIAGADGVQMTDDGNFDISDDGALMHNGLLMSYPIAKLYDQIVFLSIDRGEKPEDQKALREVSVADTKGNILTDDISDIIADAPASAHPGASLFKIVRDEDGVKILSLNANGYIAQGENHNAQLVFDAAEAQTFSILPTYGADDMEFIFSTGEHNLGMGGFTDEERRIYVDWAPQIPVKLNKQGYAAVCLPVAVNSINEAYNVTGIQTNGKDVLITEPFTKDNEVTEVIPAMTPILLKGERNATVYFTVADSEGVAPTQASFLKGVTVARQGFQSGSIYTINRVAYEPAIGIDILDENKNVIGKANINLPANTVYLVANDELKNVEYAFIIDETPVSIEEFDGQFVYLEDYETGQWWQYIDLRDDLGYLARYLEHYGYDKNPRGVWILEADEKTNEEGETVKDYTKFTLKNASFGYYMEGGIYAGKKLEKTNKKDATVYTMLSNDVIVYGDDMTPINNWTYHFDIPDGHMIWGISNDKKSVWLKDAYDYGYGNQIGGEIGQYGEVKAENWLFVEDEQGNKEAKLLEVPDFTPIYLETAARLKELEKAVMAYDADPEKNPAPHFTARDYQLWGPIYARKLTFTKPVEVKPDQLIRIHNYQTGYYEFQENHPHYFGVNGLTPAYTQEADDAILYYCPDKHLVNLSAGHGYVNAEHLVNGLTEPTTHESAQTFSFAPAGERKSGYLCWYNFSHGEYHVTWTADESNHGFLGYNNNQTIAGKTHTETTLGIEEYAYYQRVTPVTEVPVLMADGKGSIVCPVDLDVPEGVKAYIASCADNQITFSEEVTRIPAGANALIVCEEAGNGKVYLPVAEKKVTTTEGNEAEAEAVAAYAATDSANGMIGHFLRNQHEVKQESATTQENIYVLSSGIATLADDDATNEETYDAGLATLTKLTPDANGKVIVPPGVLAAKIKVNTSSISDLNADKTATDVIYDLQGRRLSTPTRGINIINGRKVRL